MDGWINPVAGTDSQAAHVILDQNKWNNTRLLHLNKVGHVQKEQTSRRAELGRYMKVQDFMSSLL